MYKPASLNLCDSRSLRLTLTFSPVLLLLPETFRVDPPAAPLLDTCEAYRAQVLEMLLREVVGEVGSAEDVTARHTEGDLGSHVGVAHGEEDGVVVLLCYGGLAGIRFGVGGGSIVGLAHLPLAFGAMVERPVLGVVAACDMLGEHVRLFKVATRVVESTCGNNVGVALLLEGLEEGDVDRSLTASVHALCDVLDHGGHPGCFRRTPLADRTRRRRLLGRLVGVSSVGGKLKGKVAVTLRTNEGIASKSAGEATGFESSEVLVVDSGTDNAAPPGRIWDAHS